MKKLTLALLLGLSLCSFQAYAGPAPLSEVNKANIFLTDFEKEVARAHGADMGRYLNRRETLTRIRELARLYPDAPKVILSTEIVALDTNFFSVRKKL
jgi:hypothetical protein